MLLVLLNAKSMHGLKIFTTEVKFFAIESKLKDRESTGSDMGARDSLL